jgi:hypothetical protein
LTIVVQCLGLACALYATIDSPRFNAPEASSSGEKAPKGTERAKQGGDLHFNPVRNLISHPSFYAFGATSFYALYSLEDWPGYLGGLGVTFFLMSIIPIVFERVAAARSYVGRTIGIAFVTYCLLTIASVFTVAYAFVPGGVYFRERTNL